MGSGRFARLDLVAAGGIVLLAVAVPAALAATAGALDIPHNDDFDYRRIALTLWADGRLELRGYSAMALLGQVVAIQPFLWLSSGAPWAFAASTALFAIAGLAAAFAAFRRALDTPRATLALLSVVAIPGFAVNTTSFMTDVPAMATAFACLAIGGAAIETGGGRVRWRLVAVSVGVGCFAVTIRESAAAAPLAVLLVAALVDRRSPWRPALGAGVVLGTVAAIHLAGGVIPGQGDLRLDPGPGLGRLRAAFSTLALVLAPALVLSIAWWRDRWRPLDVLPGLVVGMLLAWGPLETMVTTGQIPPMLIGNLFTLIGPDGAEALDGVRPALYPGWAWLTVQLAAVGMTVLLPGVVTGILGSILRDGGLHRERVRDWACSPASLLVAFTAFTALGLIVYGLAFSMFDRYLWPLAGSSAALLLIRPGSAAAAEPESPGRRVAVAPAAATVALLGLGALAGLHLLASNAFSAARWQLGEAAVAAGIPAGHVDAGMEWVGYHAEGQATPFATAPSGHMWYTAWWPSYRQCAKVSSRRIGTAGYELVRFEPAAYRQFQLAGPELPLYLYRVESEGCP